MLPFIQFVDFDMFGIPLRDLVAGVVPEIKNCTYSAVRSFAHKLIVAVIKLQKCTAGSTRCNRAGGALRVKTLYRFGKITDREFHNGVLSFFFSWIGCQQI
jgi:hypothetical protein